MSDVSRDVDKLIEYIGGAENIESLSHCATRLRFVLEDSSMADSKKVEELDFVKGSFYQGGQFQVIIGNEVEKYYSKIMEDEKIKALNIFPSNQDKIKNKGWIKKITEKINNKHTEDK